MVGLCFGLAASFCLGSGRTRSGGGEPTLSLAFAFTALIFEKTCFFGLLISAPAGCKAHTDYAILCSQGQHDGEVAEYPSKTPMRCPMEERDFFDERPEQRTHMMTCPHCGQQDEYQLSWLVRRKKTQLPRGADDRDRARFAKAQSYMVRRDDMVGCKNVRCRKRFDVAGIQSVAFI
jgi:hypothetical protein